MGTNARRSLRGILVAAGRRFDDDRGFQNAGSLAFTTLLALVPVLAVALAVASALPAFDGFFDALRRFVIANFLPRTSGVESAVAQVAVFRDNAAGMTALGLGFLAVTAVMLMLTVDDVFNRIFRVRRQRSLVRRVWIYALAVLAGPVLIGASISMTSYLVAQALGMTADMGMATRLVLRAIPFLLTFAAFALLYALVPTRRVRARHAIIGGLVASVGFELAKRGFALYVGHFPAYAMIYGAFAMLPLFLLWIYVSWVVVLLGATLVAVLSEGES